MPVFCGVFSVTKTICLVVLRLPNKVAFLRPFELLNLEFARTAQLKFYESS